MDPQATWNELLNAWQAHDWPQVQELTEALLRWLDRNGFAPETVRGHYMGNDWNQTVVAAVCRYDADTARRVLNDVHGIPEGVPFSLSCCDCDVEGPATFQEAVAEGWTEIAFCPQGVAENFLGQCPQHSYSEE